MISMAICDDDKRIIDLIQEYILDFSISPVRKIEVEGFLSGKALCGKLDTGKYFDLIFMDIEMDNGDGILAGQLLREKYGHDSTLIIYVSSHTKYHGKLFDVQPFQFIKKPINKDEFNRKLDMALKKIERGSEIYRYKKGYEYYQIQKKDIICLESKGHKIILSTIGIDPIEFRGVFREELKKLDNSFFVQTHVAYLANINHVRSFHGTHLLMDNGSIVPVSEQRAKQVKKAFLNYEVK